MKSEQAELQNKDLHVLLPSITFISYVVVVG
jgi:hypothetical protein